MAAVRIGGAVAGAALALIFMAPKTRSEFATRLAFSATSGMLFAEPVREFLKWTESIWMVLASTSLTAMLSWFVMGMVVRIVGTWKGPK